MKVRSITLEILQLVFIGLAIVLFLSVHIASGPEWAATQSQGELGSLGSNSDFEQGQARIEVDSASGKYVVVQAVKVQP
ncbi:MAG: hypothetical protein P9M14_03685 [Candidatus Alcyoniella australis]|nr:hypothetical protein [Candidatus Alcyoniella australis]